MAQLPPPASKPSAPAAPPVATVGGLRVERDEFERRTAAAFDQFLGQQKSTIPPAVRQVFRRQMLENFIRVDLLALEAKRTGALAPRAEAEAQLRKQDFFNPGGHFDESRWNAVRTSQPQRFESAVMELQAQLGAQQMAGRLEARYVTPEAQRRTQALRQLRRATVEHLQLLTSDFDGRYPEPREADVVGYYRQHHAEWHRPSRASLSVVFVNEPPLTDAERADAALTAAWNRRMKARADSLLAAIQHGTSLEQASEFLGGPRPNQVVTEDNFPGYWKGTDAQTHAVFTTPDHQLIGQPVASGEGWLIVRVDHVVADADAELREVSREIRRRLRTDSRLNHEDREALGLYPLYRDSLAAPGWRFRYAVADTGSMRVAEPSTDELDRWYRGHLADYSSFDARAGAIVARPFAQVRDDVRQRYLDETRVRSAREMANRAADAWKSGRRDAAAEAALRVRETGFTPRGADADTGFAAHVLSDTLWAGADPVGAGVVPFARGWIAWQVLAKSDRQVPSAEQALPRLREMLERRQAAADSLEGRKLFDRDPMAFSLGNVLHVSRVTINPRDIRTVKLTRADVEKWRRDHIDKYSSPESMRARHILISPKGPGAAADAAARHLADSLLTRIKAGDDFATLARAFSDDPATQTQGGDLGSFGRGVMLDAFEKAAFALQPGELAGPVKTEVGYHLIQCISHEPLFMQPLELVYANVASDAADAYVDTLASRFADSLATHLKSVAAGRALAEKLGLDLLVFDRKIGEPTTAQSMQSYFDELDRMKPGEIMRHAYRPRGRAFWITWVDSISPPHRPTWDEAHARAIEAYRSHAGERALLAKRAELDSLESAGWSLDSLGALWGGLERAKEINGSKGLGRLSGAAALDSLVFGGATLTPALQPGQESEWVAFPGGWARVRLVERTDPTPERVAARAEQIRQAEVERGMATYFETLKQRYPVRILDTELRSVQPPAPPPLED